MTGPRPRPTSATTRAKGATCLAVDIGATKLAAGLVDQAGRLTREVRSLTPPTDDGEVIWSALVDLVESILETVPSPDVVGVGCGGPMSSDRRLVSPLNIPAWRGFPLQERLSRLTGLTVRVDNDAKALALAEGWKGAAVGQSDFLAMVVSTGVGGGIISSGRLLEGRTGNAGHVGHVVVEPRGRRCRCGGRGCLEAEASGTAIGEITGASPALATRAIVERAGRLVGRAAASVASLLDLSLVVVGGSVALGFGDPFFAAAREELMDRAGLEFAAKARIVPAALGPQGPLVGAGAVGWRKDLSHGAGE